MSKYHAAAAASLNSIVGRPLNSQRVLRSRTSGLAATSRRAKSRLRWWFHVLTFVVGAVAGWAKAYHDLEKLEVERLHEITALFGKFLSQNPKERALACLVAERIDKALAVQICKLAAADTNPIVNEKATEQLRRLAQDADPKVEQTAKKALLQRSVAQELSSPEIQADLAKAANYAETRSADGQEHALDLYISILDRLSPKAIGELHSARLHQAQEAEAQGFHDDAVRQLANLFSKYAYQNHTKGDTHR